MGIGTKFDADAAETMSAMDPEKKKRDVRDTYDMMFSQVIDKDRGITKRKRSARLSNRSSNYLSISNNSFSIGGRRQRKGSARKRPTVYNQAMQTELYFDREKEGQPRLIRDDEAKIATLVDMQTKYTQFPELITQNGIDELWFKDATNRTVKQVYSLDFIKRFILSELHDENYVEKMVDDMEQKEIAMRGDDVSDLPSRVRALQAKELTLSYVQETKENEASVDDKSSASSKKSLKHLS